MSTATQTIQELANREYQLGFETPIESDTLPRGLNEDVIRLISAKKQEPEFLLEWRLKAYRHWLTMPEPRWANVRHGPMDVSTYLRSNARDTGQFERTLIIAEEGSYVSYLEGCSAPLRDENQLHAAVVELVALDNAQIKYSTVQNWYPGDREGRGGIYNFVTKRGKCAGVNSKISWTQVETGSAITWKYPSCILQGDNSVGVFY